ncbi:MAG: ABC transporter ATP-binding protein [Spirochaetales bacterium]|nr:ABC transporter ATP-binding protein [Spirochaetales bacterium]
MSENLKHQEEDFIGKKIEWKMWKSIFGYAARVKKQIYLLISMLMLLAVVDAAMPLLTGWIIDHIIIPNDLQALPWYTVILVTIFTLQAISIWKFIELAGVIESRIRYEIGKHAFDKIQKLTFSYFDKTPVGWLMARMTSDIRKLGEILTWGMVDISWGVTLMLLLAVLMVVKNWQLALVAFGVIPILVVISYFFQRVILKRYRIVRNINSRVTGGFNEGIRGAKTTKTLVREEENFREFSQLTGKMSTTSIKAARISSIYLPFVLIMGSIGTALALWRGGAIIATAGITYGDLVFFIICTTRFFDPVIEVSRVIAQFQYAQASAERILSLIDTDPDIHDTGILTTPIEGNIEFDNVSFQYVENEGVLKDFSLKVSAGETIALVGETGSGKSTIVNLICRFYEPVTGIIRIDRKDYRDYSMESLQSQLGYVLQAPHLFSGNIRENIRYGRLDATDEEVERVAEMVNAHHFIGKLEAGYDTEVGEGGAMLSTGEKQLISFARALLAQPAIFVLDEATSSVDTETELLIQHAIETVLENRTSFIIAHRLSTIRSADRILVLDEGKVLESGTHTELMEKNGHYCNLYTRQFREELEEDVLKMEL